ncbi:MAG: hypothetical protein ICV73_16060 [Acetobacteraceae bacterium]|nr:hypothetical protein [Acetobacteraceae bacterium]
MWTAPSIVSTSAPKRRRADAISKAMVPPPGKTTRPGMSRRSIRSSASISRSGGGRSSPSIGDLALRAPVVEHHAPRERGAPSGADAEATALAPVRVGAAAHRAQIFLHGQAPLQFARASSAMPRAWAAKREEAIVALLGAPLHITQEPPAWRRSTGGTDRPALARARASGTSACPRR